MTAHSALAIVPLPAESTRGSTLGATSRLKPVSFEVPPAIVPLLSLAYDGDFQDGVALKALARAKAEKVADTIPALASKALASLEPISHAALTDRLTLLGMSMANGKDAAQVKAWLHETARLLSDFPQSVLFDAIDECVKEPGRVWLPSVGEIIAKAAEPLRKKERVAARLCHLAKLIEQGVEVPPYDPDKAAWEYPRSPRPEPVKDQCTPEQAASILAEFGLPSSFSATAAKALRPEQTKSRTDYIAEGQEPPRPRPRSDEYESIRV